MSSKDRMLADRAQAEAIAQQNLVGEAGISSRLFPEYEMMPVTYTLGYKDPLEWRKTGIWSLAVAPEHREEAKRILKEAQ